MLASIAFRGFPTVLERYERSASDRKMISQDTETRQFAACRCNYLDVSRDTHVNMVHH